MMVGDIWEHLAARARLEELLARQAGRFDLAAVCQELVYAVEHSAAGTGCSAWFDLIAGYSDHMELAKR